MILPFASGLAVAFVTRSSRASQPPSCWRSLCTSMLTTNFCVKAHASASMAAGEGFVKVAVSTIVGFDEPLEARYEGGEVGAPSSSLNGTAMARIGVEDEAEVTL